mgnify:FL=1
MQQCESAVCQMSVGAIYTPRYLGWTQDKVSAFRSRGRYKASVLGDVGPQIKDDHRPPFMVHDIAPICAGFNVPICETTVSTIEMLFMNIEE